jgi:uncharacterized membrane protein
MPPQARISNIDFLRGLVMIIMALDHTRDFFHYAANVNSPLDLQTTTPVLFLTRWITHLCAPTFIFLAGTSIYLQSLRKPKHALTGFLLKRGIWLILVEIVIMTLGISFDIHYSTIILQVIWTFGISMVLLSFIIRLPFYAVFAIGVAIVAGHNLLDIYEASHQGEFPVWYRLLHRQSVWQLSEDRIVLIFYPFLPWTGVMILGYCFGRFYLSDVMNRHRRTIVLGVSILVFFVVARLLDLYGDPLKWSEQPNLLYTFFSFINTQKYPPSLLFVCMTLGISLVILGAVGDASNRLTRAIEVYGRVPLFYYIIHFYVLNAASSLLYLSRGHTVEEGMKGVPGLPFKFSMPGEGYSLAIVYLVWILVVLILYPLCKWYSDYKLSHRKWWLSYL